MLSSGSDTAEPASKFVRTSKSTREAKRIGAGAQQRRKDKFRQFQNDKTYQRRLAQVSDITFNFCKTDDRDELEKKFAEWDEILGNGGVIYDEGQVGGPVVIETKPLEDIEMDKNTLYMMNKCNEGELICEFTRFTVLPDDEMQIDAEPEQPVVKDNSPPTEYVEQIPWIEQKKTSIYTPTVISNALYDPEPLGFFDLGTGKLYQKRVIEMDLDNTIDEPEIKTLTLRHGGQDYQLSELDDLKPKPRSPDPDAPPTDFRFQVDDPLVIEIYVRIDGTLHFWTSWRVTRLLLSERAARCTQYHPLTVHEAFEPWDVRMCVYRPNSCGNYVRELVPRSLRCGPGS